MSQTNPAPCNQVLADMAAEAQVISAPVPMYPRFFSQPQCGHDGGNEFPHSIFPIHCPPSTSDKIPTDLDNCMRVIDISDDPPHQEEQLFKSLLTTSQINYFKGATNAGPSIFSLPFVLRSWYVPPGYRIYFFEDDIRLNSPNTTITGSKGYIRFEEGQLVTDACASNLTLVNGKPFYVGDCNKQETASLQAPYMVILKIKDFHQQILDMCSPNPKDIHLGTALNSLNRVWKPQAFACDAVVSAVCSDVTSNENQFKDLCACFRQKKKLDRIYGAALDVPVCCFGSQVSKTLNESCLYNAHAYKTSKMVRNCCSFAECQQLVETSTELGKKAIDSSTQKPVCVGNFVTIPLPTTTPPVPEALPTVTHSNKTETPIFIWITLGIGALFLLAFLITLAFV